MRRHFVFVGRFARTVVAVVSALGLVAAALAGAQRAAAPVRITVLADRYIVASRAFDDLDLLEKHITAIRARGISLLACGPNVTRSLKAAVHRFRHLPVQMSVLEADEPECSSAVAVWIPVRQRVDRRPRGIDEEAVELYWRDLVP